MDEEPYTTAEVYEQPTWYESPGLKTFFIAVGLIILLVLSQCQPEGVIHLQ